MEIETDSAKRGLKTAIAELHDPSISPGERSEQLPLLPLEGVGVGAEPGAVARGRGRPPGAINKNTEEWRKYLLSQYRHPLEALAQTYCIPLEDLALRLGLTGKPTFDQALELLKLQITAAKELAPYVAKKMPVEFDNAGGGLIQLVINQGNAVAAAGPNAIPQAITILNAPTQENQLVTGADFSESNETQSNENG